VAYFVRHPALSLWRHPDRCYRARLATAAEIAQHEWLDVARLPPGCFIYAISRVSREPRRLSCKRCF
jgi:hypothetical protein